MIRLLVESTAMVVIGVLVGALLALALLGVLGFFGLTI